MASISSVVDTPSGGEDHAELALTHTPDWRRDDAPDGRACSGGLLHANATRSAAPTAEDLIPGVDWETVDMTSTIVPATS